MLLTHTWGSRGDVNKEEALFTKRTTDTKCPIVVAVAASGSSGSLTGAAMISSFVPISICA